MATITKEELINKFKKHDVSTPHFSLNGLSTYGRLVDIYDGDTLKIVLQVLDGFYKFDVRLKGIDTCELKSQNVENKKRALKARHRVCKMVEEEYGNDEGIKFETSKEIKEYLQNIVSIVYVKCYEFDKYGRVLADVYIGNESTTRNSISEILLRENLAYVYDGGSRN
jgi:endonuclease YncB( thermonuclease family)